MAVRTLDQVIAELSGVYNPQINLVKKQQSAIPGQIQAEEKGLEAKQTQAFDDILGGARRRGLGFAGIPLQEQAKYTSTEFLPAIARLRQSGQERATTLEQSLNSIYERRNTLGQQLRQGDIDNDYRERAMAEEKRRFDAQLAESRRAAAAANSFSPTLGGISPSGGQAPKATKQAGVNPDMQWAAASVKGMLGRSTREILSDYVAALNYYKKTGSPGDRYKIMLYEQQRPELFKGYNNSAGVISPNLRGVTF